jgi:hypothetical protein
VTWASCVEARVRFLKDPKVAGLLFLPHLRHWRRLRGNDNSRLSGEDLRGNTEANYLGGAFRLDRESTPLNI